jgi:GntR family transcriptional regulator
MYSILYGERGDGFVNILVSGLSQTPIYEQIQVQIKELALSGKLKAGEQLPSIRLMAKDLKVGVITVKRAYEELEKEGIITNLQGRGCFVNELNTARVRQIHLGMLKERLCEIKEFADASSISQNDFLEAVNEIYGGRDSDKQRT